MAVIVAIVEVAAVVGSEDSGSDGSRGCQRW